MRQKIFAFQPREDDRFFVPTDSYLYKVFTSGSETLRGEKGYVVTHEELKHTLDREIPEYIRLRAREQQKAYRRRLRFDPCMEMLTGSECSNQDCQFQHIRPDQMTVSWFNARVRSVLMEIRILNLTGFRFKGIFTCVLPLTVTAPDSDLIRIDNGSASFTLSCTLRHQSSGQSPHSILGIRLSRQKGSGFCENGSGRRATSSCSAPEPRRSSTSKPSFQTLCLFARWRTTSTSNGRKSMSPGPGCTDSTSGPRASLDLDRQREVTLLSGTSLCFCTVVPIIH